LKLKKGNDLDRKFWDIFPREDTPIELVWNSISERIRVGKGDLIAISRLNQEVPFGTFLIPGDYLEIAHRAQFTPGHGVIRCKEGKATLTVGRITRRDGVVAIDNILRNARRTVGTGGCLIKKGESIWDGSPVQDGDQFSLQALGPGGGKSSSSEDSTNDIETIWQQSTADEWPQQSRGVDSDNDEIFRPADLLLETSIQELEAVSEMEMRESAHPFLQTPVVTHRFQKVQIITMTRWGELTHTMETRRYHKPKRVPLMKRRLQKIDGKLGITRERPNPTRFKQLTDESVFLRVIEHSGDVPRDRTSRIELPVPVMVLVKCGGEVLRRAGHWVQDITEALRSEGRLSGKFRVWINQEEGRKFDALRKGMFLTYTAGEQELSVPNWTDWQRAVRVEEEDQTWVEMPEIVLDYVLSLIAFRAEKEIVVVRNRHLWQLDEEIEAGDRIRISTASGGGMFPGGLVGWQEGVTPMEWINIAEVQLRLGQRNQARLDQIIYVLRNVRHWDGQPPQMFDIFRIVVQGWGGTLPHHVPLRQLNAAANERS
jgi:hypothetical protein